MQVLTAGNFFSFNRSTIETTAETSPLSLHYEIADRIWGPFGRFHIAAYAVEVQPGRHIAYAKVFKHRPRDFWDGCGIAKFVTDMAWGSPMSAILDAVFIAQYALERRHGSAPDVDLETGPAPLCDLHLD
ncbi:MAG: hypothetical protein V4787_09695 [Pseudomonadota bacterium]